MEGMFGYAVFFAVVAAVMGCFALLARHVRRRGIAGSAMRAAMAAHDEAFRVTAHESHYEIRAQVRRKAPMASPDGRWRLRIGLRRRGRVGEAGR